MKIERCAALVAAGLLSACGGGGGGGDGPGSNLQPVRTTMQAPNTTQSYQASSAAGWVDPMTGLTSTGIDPAGAGSTVTITTDADGNIEKFEFSTNTAGVGFSAEGRPLREPGGFLAETDDFIFGSLSYSVFGVWTAPDGGSFGRVGVFAAGVETAAGSVPLNGNATYNGMALGLGTDSNGAFAFAGDAQIVADFSSQSVRTTFSSLVTHDPVTNKTDTLPPLSGTSTITGNKYSGSINGGALSGNVEGAFYGPGAEETAGVLRAQGGGTTLLGSYGARR